MYLTIIYVYVCVCEYTLSLFNSANVVYAIYMYSRKYYTYIYIYMTI